MIVTAVSAAFTQPNPQWVSTVGAINASEGLEVIESVAEGGGYYVAGYAQDSLDGHHDGYVARLTTAGVRIWEYYLEPMDPAGDIRIAAAVDLGGDSLRVIYTESSSTAAAGVAAQLTLSYDPARGNLTESVRAPIAVHADSYHRVVAVATAPGAGYYYVIGTLTAKSDRGESGFVAKVTRAGETVWGLTDAEIPVDNPLATTAIHAHGREVYVGLSRSGVVKITDHGKDYDVKVVDVDPAFAGSNGYEFDYQFASDAGGAYCLVDASVWAKVLYLGETAVTELGGAADAALVRDAPPAEFSLTPDSARAWIPTEQGLFSVAVARDGSGVSTSATDMGAVGAAPPCCYEASVHTLAGGGVLVATRAADPREPEGGLLVELQAAARPQARVRYRFGGGGYAPLVEPLELLPRSGGGACALYRRDGILRLSCTRPDGTLASDNALDTTLATIAGRVYGAVSGAGRTIVLLTELALPGRTAELGVVRFDEGGRALYVNTLEGYREGMNLGHVNHTLFANPDGVVSFYGDDEYAGGRAVRVYDLDEELDIVGTRGLSSRSVWRVDQVLPLSGGAGLVYMGTTRDEPTRVALWYVDADGDQVWGHSFVHAVSSPHTQVRERSDGKIVLLVQNSPIYRAPLQEGRHYVLDLRGRIPEHRYFDLGELNWYRPILDIETEAGGLVGIESEFFESPTGIAVSYPVIYKSRNFSDGASGYVASATLPIAGAEILSYLEHEGETYLLGRRAVGTLAEAGPNFPEAPATARSATAYQSFVAAYEEQLSPATAPPAPVTRLVVYPNPATAGTEIGLEGASHLRRLRIADVLGRDLGTVSLEAGRGTLPYLSSGTYVLSGRDERRSYLARFVVHP